MDRRQKISEFLSIAVIFVQLVVLGKQQLHVANIEGQNKVLQDHIARADARAESSETRAVRAETLVSTISADRDRWYSKYLAEVSDHKETLYGQVGAAVRQIIADRQAVRDVLDKEALFYNDQVNTANANTKQLTDLLNAATERAQKKVTQINIPPQSSLKNDTDDLKQERLKREVPSTYWLDMGGGFHLIRVWDDKGEPRTTVPIIDDVSAPYTLFRNRPNN